MNILPVVVTQDILEFQHQKVPREQLKTISLDKEVSTLLVVVATNIQPLQACRNIRNLHQNRRSSEHHQIRSLEEYSI